MASSILSIGTSALNAAQVGINTTGHNIANAATPGYSRQIVMQSAAQAQDFGYGYLGQGTQISSITRVYNEILSRQLVASQSNSAAVNTYRAQLGSIDTMLSDPTAGLNPALNSFFSSVHDLTASPSDTPTRQAMLSSAQFLVNRLHGTSDRLNEIRDGVNSQLTASVSMVNTYAKQISALNDTIEKAVSAGGNTPNDLMDQRDQLVLELSKLIKTTVVPQGQGSYNIFVGSGLPLVVGKDTFSLAAVNSPTNPSRLEVAYQSQTTTTVLGVESLPGGSIGGLLQFRTESLDAIQNQLGQLSMVLAQTFNTQHEQGLDLNGAPGGPMFSLPLPAVNSSVSNTGTATVASSIVDAHQLTSSDYRLQFDGTNYKITRINDSTVQSFTSLPQTLDGLTFSQTGAMAAGDEFVIRPTLDAATSIKLAITDISKLAVGGPVTIAAAPLTNTGTGSISIPAVSSAYAATPLTGPITLSYNAGDFSFVPVQAVTVTTPSGVSTNYPAGALVPFTSGATITASGVSFSVSGAPANSDQFTITPNTANAPGDNRNGLLLAGLQSKGTMNGGNTSFANAFSQIISSVGNKTRELIVTGAAESKVLEQVTAAVQGESGVNLDEEATNLMRYQQAYQAAGKLMQIASQLFDTLLQIGH